jgi:hypothetical protein
MLRLLSGGITMRLVYTGIETNSCIDFSQPSANGVAIVDVFLDIIPCLFSFADSQNSLFDILPM